MLASTSGGALFSRSTRSLSFWWRLSRRWSVFCLLKNEKKKTTVSSSSSRRTRLQSNPRSPLGRRPKFYNSWRHALQKRVQYHPVVVVLHSFSLSLSLSLCGAFVLEMCACTNADWLFFRSLFNQYSDDGNVINDQQHRRCCCFLGEVVLQTKSSKCNDDE